MQIKNFEKQRIIPPKLKSGDRIRVLALSRTIGGIIAYEGITEADIAFARQRLESMGFIVEFGEHIMECNAHLTTSVESRIEDLHCAIIEPSVKMILAATGGVGAIQLLEHIDYELIKSHPKIICGYSDITHIANAVFANTGVVGYYGPNFSSFMMRKGFEYTMEYFQKCLCSEESFSANPAETWSDDAWVKEQDNRTFLHTDGFWPVNYGNAEGVIVGGAALAFNHLQGSKFFPSLKGAILFLESPSDGKASLMALDSCIRAICFQEDFKGVRGIVIGRYPRNSRIDRNNLTELVHQISEISEIPIAANVDFGHTTPVMTVPIGGKCILQVRQKDASIEIVEH